jgi:hypothetical protein
LHSTKRKDRKREAKGREERNRRKVKKRKEKDFQCTPFFLSCSKIIVPLDGLVTVALVGLVIANSSWPSGEN